MVKTANLRYGNDGCEFRRVHGPRFRRVLSQREVHPGFVIVRQERLHVPIQRGLVEDNHVVQTLPAESADQAFDVRSPGTVSVMFLGLIQPAALLWHLSEGGFDVTQHVDGAWNLLSETLRAS